MQYLSLGTFGHGFGEDELDIEKLLESARSNVNDIRRAFSGYISCRYSGEQVYIAIERELKELKEICDKFPKSSRAGVPVRNACKILSKKWKKYKNEFKKKKSKKNISDTEKYLLPNAEKYWKEINKKIQSIKTKKLIRVSRITPMRRPLRRKFVSLVRRHPVPRELVRRVVRRHPAVRRLVRRMRYARRFGRPRFSDYGGLMGMMALEDFSMTRPTRKIPEPQWLREFLAPAEEVIYQTAGMQPPYYAPIAPEVPPAYRIPMDMQRYREQTIQGRTQMTAYPPLYYAQAASRNLSVPSPRQFPPIEIESPFTPSGVRMLI